MIHLLGEQYVPALVKGLEKFPLARILRSQKRADDFNKRSGHHNLVAESSDSQYPIDKLIVTTPPQETIASMHRVVDRLSDRSTILMCDSLPWMQEQVKSVWANRSDAPQFLMALPPTQMTFLISGENRRNELAREILNSTSGWMADWYPQRELRLLQLENLVVNACLEPLVAVFNCPAKSLATSEHVHLIYQLVTESCQIVGAYFDEPLMNAKRMQNLIFERAKRDEFTGIKQALETGNSRRADYLNGKLCSMAAKLGLPHVYNSMLWDLVSARALIDKPSIT